MSCTCPRCDQGGGECLYDEIERLKSTITHQAAAIAAKDKALGMAVETIQNLRRHESGCPKEIFKYNEPENWGCTCQFAITLAACREVLK